MRSSMGFDKAQRDDAQRHIFDEIALSADAPFQHFWLPTGTPIRRHCCCAIRRDPRRYGFGSMFWFRRNRLDGSNRAFSRASRLYFASP
jgi:hypothetical protein